VENINNYGHQFILPTHSPYILSALNNCLYAYNLSKIENGKYTKQEYLDKVQANLAKKTKGQRDEYFTS
jgi:predicted ATPase